MRTGRYNPSSNGHTCSTVATTGNLSRSKMSMHSCAILKCNENCEFRVGD
jgi:hypothetical protein